MLLAVALAVRAPRLAHVCVDLATVRETATTDLDEPVDVQALPWPDVDAWIEALSASPLVAAGDDAAGEPAAAPRRHPAVPRPLLAPRGPRRRRPARPRRPTRRHGRRRSAVPRAGPLLRRTEPDLQRAAAAAAVRHRLTVVAGGPGTGKTTTVARILALLDEQAAEAGQRPPRVALAAPTAKAAARLEEAVRTEAAAMPVAETVRTRLTALSASTLHRLLGFQPGNRSRFRHNRHNRLPHDVVVVDETSMVSLSLMAKLVEAVRTDARLILVGDPDQLASVEAGAVLGDIVGPASDCRRPSRRPRSATGSSCCAASTASVAGSPPSPRRSSAATRTPRSRRSAPAPRDVQWIAVDVADDALSALGPVRERVVAAGRRITDAAAAGDGRAALDAMRAMRVLCAHRRGPYGVTEWTGHVERWLAAAIDGYAMAGPWYVGRPLLVTANDYTLRLYNGDTGVVVDRGEGRPVAVFERAGEPVDVSPRRLGSVDTVHAMTIHKSQGSQFDAVAVILPDAASPILTRELLYTAATRAQRHLTVVGSEESIRAAVARPIARASGLRRRLWT